MSVNNTAYILKIYQSEEQVQHYLDMFFSSKPKFALERDFKISINTQKS